MKPEDNPKVRQLLILKERLIQQKRDIFSQVAIIDNLLLAEGHHPIKSKGKKDDARQR